MTLFLYLYKSNQKNMNCLLIPHIVIPITQPGEKNNPIKQTKNQVMNTWSLYH